MIELSPHNLTSNPDRNRLIKCIVWDLDNTLWDGILLEDEKVVLRSDAVRVIKTLDERGILHSIASRNDYERGVQQLKQFRLRDFFLYPQINWNAKTASIKTIAAAIDIGLEAIAFVDDDPFEIEELIFSHPEVLCIEAKNLGRLPEMIPDSVTPDARHRRLMYLSNIKRQETEEQFVGSREDFLATLDMTLSIGPAVEDDLTRAAELTVRTHQLNATGYTYSYDQLRQFCKSDRHQLLIASLKDKYGTHGKIGLALLECEKYIWTIKLLLISCRVVSRGVGTIMLNHIMGMASKQNVALRAEFVPNERNRMMLVAFKFAGFREHDRRDNVVILENDLAHIQAPPSYVKVQYPAPCRPRRFSQARPFTLV